MTRSWRTRLTILVLAAAVPAWGCVSVHTSKSEEKKETKKTEPSNG